MLAFSVVSKYDPWLWNDFQMYFRLVFWPPFEVTCSLCFCVGTWSPWHFSVTCDLSPLRRCKLHQYEICACPRREISQQLGSGVLHVSQGSFHCVLGLQSQMSFLFSFELTKRLCKWQRGDYFICSCFYLSFHVKKPICIFIISWSLK